jgi:hypothetical protein
MIFVEKPVFKQSSFAIYTEGHSHHICHILSLPVVTVLLTSQVVSLELAMPHCGQWIRAALPHQHGTRRTFQTFWLLGNVTSSWMTMWQLRWGLFTQKMQLAHCKWCSSFSVSRQTSDCKPQPDVLYFITYFQRSTEDGRNGRNRGCVLRSKGRDNSSRGTYWGADPSVTTRWALIILADMVEYTSQTVRLVQTSSECLTLSFVHVLHTSNMIKQSFQNICSRIWNLIAVCKILKFNVLMLQVWAQCCHRIHVVQTFHCKKTTAVNKAADLQASELRWQIYYMHKCVTLWRNK